jgi:hypothetical protein
VPPPDELAARLTAGGRQQALPAFGDGDDRDDPIARLRRLQRTLDDAVDDDVIARPHRRQQGLDAADDEDGAS